MIQPEMSPTPRGPRPDLGSRQISGDDIDLPALTSPPTTSEPSLAGKNLPQHKSQSPQKSVNLLALAGLIAAAMLGGWWWYAGQMSESANANWSQVVAAQTASADQHTTVVMHRDLSGKAHASPTVAVSQADSNPSLTLAMQAMLGKNDLVGAKDLLAGPQLSPATPGAKKQAQAKPTLRPNTRLITAIRDGNAQFFNMRLFDCCAEDGDVVDIAINGESYSRVPLTHEGTVLSLPLIPGKTVISIKGVHDGGGGITVSFQSSQGDYFCQPIHEGDEFEVGVVIR